MARQNAACQCEPKSIKKMQDWNIAPLERLGNAFAGEEWERAVAAAGGRNSWFTRGQVERAVAAVRRGMFAPNRLREWLAAYRKPAAWQPVTVGVVTAGNLPLVGLADLAAAVAVGHRVVVKPSSKDRPLTEFVVERLREAGAVIEVVEKLEADGVDGVIATGGDAAREAFEREFRGIPALLRGSRLSAAVLNGAESEAQLAGLAEDMFLYWGLGCRSVTRLWVPRGYDMKALAERLRLHLPFAEDEAAQYRSCYRYARAMAAMNGETWVDGGAFVLRQVAASAPPMAPKLAEVEWSEYTATEEVAAWLALHESRLQCVAGEAPDTFPRRVALGQTQHPRWTDYADGVDTVAFLLSLQPKER